MAKTKPNSKSQKNKKNEKNVLNRVAPTPSSSKSAPQPTIAPSVLLAQAVATLQQGDLTGSVPLAKQALQQLQTSTVGTEILIALNILGEIHVELGEIEEARKYFLEAARIDPDGSAAEEQGGGAEKFLWLAQLSKVGGKDSVAWFEKGAAALRRQILELGKSKDEEAEMLVDEKQKKLATALCSVAEVYMTDLSWEEDAEQKCEALVTEATMMAPDVPEPWQTLASVRISQMRGDDARAALKRSLELWRDLPPEDEGVPDYPTRVSLARLLMEAELEEEAIEVLERLVGEDDSSVEVWYLGGWGLYILGEKQKEKEGQAAKSDNEEGASSKISWISSKQWLSQSMRLFEMQDYEDERLGEHAKELLAILDKELGDINPDVLDDEDAWEDDDGADEDEEMDES